MNDDDIVTRLRTFPTKGTALQAAAEIERLRAAGDRLVNAIEDHEWLNVDALIGEWQECRHV